MALKKIAKPMRQIATLCSRAVMKPNKPGKKLHLDRITVAVLTPSDLRSVAGGMPPRDGTHTASVCGTACCDTDQFTNCASRPGICW
jgi:hypothetical protein